MSYKSLLIALFTIFGIQAQSLAQNDVEEIKSLIKTLTKNVEALLSEGSSRADDVMKYTNDKFIYHQQTINIMNIITTDTYDKNKLSFMLHELRNSGVDAKRILGSLNDIVVRDNLGLARYEVNYELYEGERLINRGIQYNQLILRKNPSGKWLLEYLSSLNVDDITFKSLCICEIYETQGIGNILTETIVPDGHEADVLEDKFSIDESTQPRLVRHGYRDYWWGVEGSINIRKADGTKGNQVGVAKSRQELILTLLKKEVYPDRCNNIIRRLR